MMKRHVAVALGLVVSGCVHPLPARPSAVEEDPTVVLPQFFAQPPIVLGAPGQTAALDGVTLRALSVVVDDFLPSRGGEVPCMDRPEAHVYRVIREGDLIFIRVDENPTFCGRPHGRLDSGAKYAVRGSDGKILRRVLDGAEPYVAPEDGGMGEPGAPGVSPAFEQPDPSLSPPPSRDGG